MDRSEAKKYGGEAKPIKGQEVGEQDTLQEPKEAYDADRSHEKGETGTGESGHVLGGRLKGFRSWVLWEATGEYLVLISDLEQRGTLTSSRSAEESE